MQGLASYRWPRSCPSRSNVHWICGWMVLAIVALLAQAGCRPSPPEAVDKPAPTKQNSIPPAKIEPAGEAIATTESQEVEASLPAKTQADATIVEVEDESAVQVAPGEAGASADDEEPALIEPISLPPPKDAVRLSPTDEVWINRDKKEVYVGGQVALRRGLLEMLACKKGTKEHESVVALNSLAATIHAALLAVGAVPGTPVSYDPEYTPPTGTEIDITVEWKDPQDNWHSADAREWVRNVRTGKKLDVPWVFAGSGFYKDEETGKEHYLAESGDVICVSNFGTAMLDLPVESTQAEAGLLFEAFSDRIPALGTPVRLVLRPRVDKEDES